MDGNKLCLEKNGWHASSGLQEGNLLSTEEQKDYDIAIKALSLHFDQSRDFCLACQKDNEMVTDYIR